jgi:hypothetical protein
MRADFISIGLRGARTCLVAAAAALVVGCASVTLVSSYDNQIDSGLTDILADTTTFVTTMNAEAGTPPGEYGANLTFYATEHGRVAALSARAEAHRALGSCPSASVAARVVAAADAQPSVKQALTTIGNNDCEVILLQQLDAAFADLAKFHASQGARGLPASAAGPILQGGIGSIARAGITVELAKKAAEAKGGS